MSNPVPLRNPDGNEVLNPEKMEEALQTISNHLPLTGLSLEDQFEAIEELVAKVNQNLIAHGFEEDELFICEIFSLH